MGTRREVGFGGTERFKVKHRLGAGGMGVVYEAYDRERGMTVALKTLRHIDASALARFKREFRALQDLEHPNLISLGELIVDSGEWFFTMELVRGKQFLHYVRPENGAAPADELGRSDTAEFSFSATSPTDAEPFGGMHDGNAPPSAEIFDEPRLRAALAQLAQGVTALHRGGKLHRDIKPSNILIDSSGRLVLLDFGLVTNVASDRQSSVTSMVGTVEYMAPEQATGRAVGPAADWYAMGVVLYEALTRRLPHVGTNAFDLLMKKQQRAPLPAQRLVADLPADLSELCHELLHVDAEKRPSGPEILERLGAELLPAAGESFTSLAAAPSSVLLSAFIQQTPFVGRKRELAFLHSAFAASRKGKAVSVFVHGESGLGKSELVSEFTRALTHPGEQNEVDDLDHLEDLDDLTDVIVLHGRCYERESVPYKAFDGIADALSRYLAKLPNREARQLLPLRAGLLPHLFPALQQVDAIAGARMQTQALLDPQERRARMFQAFRELLARLATRQPVVLVIDDFQWAGADSLTMLEEVMHASDAPELLLIGTARPGTQALLDKHSSGDVRHLHLEELSVEHAHELVTQLAPVLDGEQVQTIVDETAGHPLFILELVRYLSEGGTSAGMRLDDALWARIGGLDEPTRFLLEVLAVAGAPIAQEAAASAAGLPFADYEKAVRSLRIGFLARTKGSSADTVEPYHDRIREAVLARISDETRIRHHRELANTLQRSGVATSDPQVLVRHFAAAGEPARAAAHAEAAALAASAMSAFDRSAELFRTALDLGGHSEAKLRELCLSLGASLVAAGRGQEAADVFLRAADGANASIRLNCQRQAAEQLLISGHLERGIEGMTNLLAEIGVRIPETPRRALFSLLWQRAKLRLRGLGWKERDETQITAEQLTRLDIYKVVSHGLGMIDIIRGMDFQARGLLLALRTGERSRVAQALFYEAVFISSGGPKRVTRSRALLAEGSRVAAPLNDPYLTAWEIVADGCREYFNGRYRPAAVYLAKAEKPFRESAGATWEQNTARLFRLWSLHRIGALAEMTPLLRDYLRDAKRRGDRYVETTILRSCHRVLLVTSSVAEARQVVAQAQWVPSQDRYHLQHWFDFYARAEISLYSGATDSLADTVRENSQRIESSLLLRIRSVRVELQWLRARVLLVTSPDKKALRRVSRSAKKLEREGCGFSLVLAKLIRAALAVQHDDPVSARTHLSSVISHAEREDMFLYAAVARFRLAELADGAESEELADRAREQMSKEGADDPVRMAELLAPGFARASPSAALIQPRAQAQEPQS